MQIGIVMTVENGYKGSAYPHCETFYHHILRGM